MTEPAILLSPQQRLKEAKDKFDALNRSLPAGMPPFHLPPTLPGAALTDALADLLIAAGIFDRGQLELALTQRMAEMVEEMTVQAAEVKRQALGLVIARPGAGG